LFGGRWELEAWQNCSLVEAMTHQSKDEAEKIRMKSKLI